MEPEMAKDTFWTFFVYASTEKISGNICNKENTTGVLDG